MCSSMEGEVFSMSITMDLFQKPYKTSFHIIVGIKWNQLGTTDLTFDCHYKAAEVNNVTCIITKMMFTKIP